MIYHHGRLSLCRALYLRGEDAVQLAVHPGAGGTLLQVQPRGKAGLELSRSTQEGKSETKKSDTRFSLNVSFMSWC